MRAETEQRPRLASEGAAKNTGGRSESHSTPLSARARRRDHGIRVVFERADLVVCSQVFATIESAERKVFKVRGRGLRAEMQLVRLVPVGVELDHDTVPSTVVDLLDGGWSE